MSTNGYVVTPKAVEIEGSNRRRQNGITSEKVRLDGNIARRKVKAKEFLVGYRTARLWPQGLRCGLEELVRSVPPARQAEAGHTRPPT